VREETEGRRGVAREEERRTTGRKEQKGVSREEELVRKMEECGLGPMGAVRRLEVRGGRALFTPQPERREPVPMGRGRRYDSPLLEAHRFPRPQVQQGKVREFSSPRSERGVAGSSNRGPEHPVGSGGPGAGLGWSPARSQPGARHSPFPRSSLASSPNISPFPRAPQPPLTSPPYAPASPRSPPYTPASPPYTPAGLRSPPYSAGDEVVYARPGPGLGARSLTQGELRRATLDGERVADPDRIIKKGLLWVQHDKLFSRWKERFVILTADYIQIFKKASSRISEMGAFQYKVRISEVSTVRLEDRKGYLTLAVTSKQGRMLLRRTEGISEWGRVVEQAVAASRGRQESLTMASTDQFWRRKQKSEVEEHSIQQWLQARDRIGQQYSYQTPPGSTRPRRGQQLPRPLPSPSPALPPSSSSSPGIPISSHYFSPTSPPTSQYKTEEDSGFESLVTTNSDSGSSSSHQVPLSPGRSPRPNLVSPRDFRGGPLPTYQNLRGPAPQSSVWATRPQ